MAWQFNPTDLFCIKVMSDVQDPLWQLCEQLEFNVFRECHYVAPYEQGRLDDFDRFQRSVFVASVDGKGGVTGSMRLVFHQAVDMQKTYFPTLGTAQIKKWPEREQRYLERDLDCLILYPEMYDRVMALPASSCVDVSTMTILREQRNAKISRAIITRATFLAWEMSVRYALGAIDTLLLSKLIQRGMPFHALGPSVVYWGSPTTPVIMDTHHIPMGLWRLMIPLMRLKGKIGREI